MKHIKQIILFSALVSSFAACNEPPKEIKEVSVNVKVNLPENAPVPENYTVQFINYNDNYKVEKTMDSQGRITAEIIPGIYTISVRAEIHDQAFTLIYSGARANEVIINDGANYAVDVQLAKTGTLVFKELYYCGSRTPSNATYFRDQFYEIYNNSETTVYLDSLCIGTMLPLTATANLPTWITANPDDYVFFGSVWQLSGSGSDYPLQPGESALICQWATNHTVSTLNPNSINLSSGEFEAYIPTSPIMTDGPARNMTWIFNSGSVTPQWLTTVFGAAFAIFYPDATVDFNERTAQEGSSAYGNKIARSLIIDAVELVSNASSVQLKRIPPELDAGAIFVSGTYVGESVARKPKETLSDGRIIYQDTNNSAADFEVQPSPLIRRNNAGKPAWNTWGN
jgi:hypothetical protein